MCTGDESQTTKKFEDPPGKWMFFFFPPNSHLIEEPPREAGCSDNHCPSTQSASDCGTMRKIAKPAVLFSAQFSPKVTVILRFLRFMELTIGYFQSEF